MIIMTKGSIFYSTDSEFDIGAGFKAYMLSEGPQTLHAYLITRDAAIMRLTHVLPMHRAIDLYDHLPYEIRFCFNCQTKTCLRQ